MKIMKDKNYMIISIEAEKALNKIQHPFMVLKKKQPPQKVDIGATYLNIIKTIHGKHTENVIFCEN